MLDQKATIGPVTFWVANWILGSELNLGKHETLAGVEPFLSLRAKNIMNCAMDPAMHRCAMFLSKTLLIDTLTFPIHAINEWGTGLTSHATWDSQMKKKFKVNRIIIMKLSARQFLANAHPRQSSPRFLFPGQPYITASLGPPIILSAYKAQYHQKNTNNYVN